MVPSAGAFASTTTFSSRKVGDVAVFEKPLVDTPHQQTLLQGGIRALVDYEIAVGSRDFSP
jgi:hypothetical protein